jgi:hypothetical protein
MPYCKECGKNLPAGAKFCSNCGNRVSVKVSSRTHLEPSIMKNSSIVMTNFFSFFASSSLYWIIGAYLGYFEGFHAAVFAFYLFFFVFTLGIILLFMCRLGWMASLWEKTTVYKFGAGIVAIVGLIGLFSIDSLGEIPWVDAVAMIFGPAIIIFGIIGLSALVAKKIRVGAKEIMFFVILIFLAVGASNLTQIYDWIGLLPYLFSVWVCVSIGTSMGREKAAASFYPRIFALGYLLLACAFVYFPLNSRVGTTTIDSIISVPATVIVGIVLLLVGRKRIFG